MLALWLLVLTIAPFGCIVSSPENEADGLPGTASEAISNGYSMGQNESGNLALKTWPDGWTFCSAVLMTNTKALTAKHCLDAWPSGQSLYALTAPSS